MGSSIGRGYLKRWAVSIPGSFQEQIGQCGLVRADQVIANNPASLTPTVKCFQDQ